MARRDGNKTRVKIMDVAEAMILANGYAATSIDQILEQVGVTKGTFFYHFSSKAELAEALIRRFAELDLDNLRAKLARAEKLSRDPAQQVILLVGLYAEEAEALTEPYPGCLFATYCYESGQFAPATLAVVEETILEWRRVVGDKLRQALSLHTPRLPVDAESLADLVTVVSEGAFIVSRVLKEPQVFAQQLQHLKGYLELLFETPAPAA